MTPQLTDEPTKCSIEGCLQEIHRKGYCRVQHLRLSPSADRTKTRGALTEADTEEVPVPAGVHAHPTGGWVLRSFS